MNAQEEVKKEYCKLELTTEQKELMQEYFDSIEQHRIAYAHCAYKTGFLDCLAILIDLKIIGE